MASSVHPHQATDRLELGVEAFRGAAAQGDEDRSAIHRARLAGEVRECQCRLSRECLPASNEGKPHEYIAQKRCLLYSTLIGAVVCLGGTLRVARILT